MDSRILDLKGACSGLIEANDILQSVKTGVFTLNVLTMNDNGTQEYVKTTRINKASDSTFIEALSKALEILIISRESDVRDSAAVVGLSNSDNASSKCANFGSLGN